MKKVLLIISLVITITSAIPCSAYAAEPFTPIIMSTQDNDIAPYSEETVWTYRTTEDGKLQKRLWSITHGIWLTDWIDMN